jgi:hypothetical protein
MSFIHETRQSAHDAMVRASVPAGMVISRHDDTGMWGFLGDEVAECAELATSSNVAKRAAKRAKPVKQHGPTALQAAFIALTSRPNGATGAELRIPEVEGNAKSGTISFSYTGQQIERASAKWDTRCMFEVREKRYFLRQVSVRWYDAAMADRAAPMSEATD